MTGGSEAGYRKILTAFCHDAQERLDFFLMLPEEETLPLFTTQAHALKSAAAVIGAASISAKAAALERAGRDGNINAIESDLPIFYEELSELVDSIAVALGPEEDEWAAAEADGKTVDIAAHAEKLQELRDALLTEEIRVIDSIIAELEETPFDAKTRKAIVRLSEQVLIAEFAEALAIVDALLNRDAG
jgi:HPt (histidine-containing phosphotransfer) domain-containing protein